MLIPKVERTMTVEELLADVLSRQVLPLNPDQTLDSLPGWDSIMTVRLMIRLEERVGRELSDSELENIASIADVQALLSANAAP